MSENIDHSMFSFDLLRTKVFGLLNTNLNRSQSKNDCYVTYNSLVPGKIMNDKEEISLELNINKPYTYYNIDKVVLKAFYWDGERVKHDILYDSESDSKIDGFTFTPKNITITEWSNEKEKLEAESSMYDSYVGLKGSKHELIFNNSSFDAKYLYYNIDVTYTPYTVAEVKGEIDDKGFENTKEDGTNVLILGNESKTYSIGLIKDYKKYFEGNIFDDDYKNALISSIFVHGRSLNADEINYFDNIQHNQCLPTKWYDTQHPFEFEVVVNEPKGLHKIFDNLMIISNNVEPESFEVEITGDVYGFDKKGIFTKVKGDPFVDMAIIPNENYRLSKRVNTRIHWDPIENSYSLAVHQDSINIKDYGRRLGNIYYNEDKWYITLKPIYFKEGKSLKSTKIRDKYAKIRVKYSGDKLAIIVALQSLFTLSYV